MSETIRRQMKAALLHGPGDIRIHEIPVPDVGEGEVLVRVRVALTCGTDLKTFHRGFHIMLPGLPSGLGHEFSGVLEAVGEGVEGIEPGTSVIAANSGPCLECEYCRSGRQNLCDNLQFLNGAYAEFVRIPASIVRSNLHRIPDGVRPVEAALTEPLACVLHGFERCGILPGQRVCVLGVGPIGLMFVALASKKGAKVIAVGRSPAKLETARRMGAWATVSLADENGLEGRVRELTPDSRGPDVVIEAIGLARFWEMAISLVKKGGLVNLFGGCAKGSQVRIDAHRFHYEEKRIISVFHHTPAYVLKALKLIQEGVIDVDDLVTHYLSIDELGKAFELMRLQKALKVGIVISE